MTMDYSLWVERENWPFLRVAISPKPGKVHHHHIAALNFEKIVLLIFFKRHKPSNKVTKCASEMVRKVQKNKEGERDKRLIQNSKVI